MKLPISIGILSWKSESVLIDTLNTYKTNGLFEITDDVTILFQEYDIKDYQIAKSFGINHIALNTNEGIGEGFSKLARFAKYDTILLLEHDWKLIENKDVTVDRLTSGINLLNNGFSVVRYRHRKTPGYPHFSFRHIGYELTYFDDEIGLTSPHLIDSLHWLEPDVAFSEFIQKNGEYFITTSRYGNWTNNPCMYKRNFYLQVVDEFKGSGVELEGNISKWWARQNFKVAHGEGLFTHIDNVKYGK